MNRREFFHTSAGFSACMISPGLFKISYTKKAPHSYSFRRYQPKSSLAPVYIVTPNDGYYIHTFYDVNPFSPSGRLLAVNKFPFQQKRPAFGETADVCIVDLENETIETVYTTKGWGFQLGANLNWGNSDRYLYANDVIDNEAVCVRIDLNTREVKAYNGPMYHLSPDEKKIIGFPLDIINATQKGYGVPLFRETKQIKGAPDNEGIWETNLETNKKILLLSLQKAAASVTDSEYLEDGNCYFFHTKYNPLGTKIMQVFRCLFPNNPDKKGWNPMLLTFSNDGSGIHETISRKQWSHGGHHPNWHPDGEHLIMNLTPVWLGHDKMRFCMFHHTGKDFKILNEKLLGSGHPSVDPQTKYLISDCYQHESMALSNGHVPIRFVHLPTGEEQAICTVFTDLDINTSTLRVDPHPVWSGDYQKICFNGAPEGKRQVFIADLKSLI